MYRHKKRASVAKILKFKMFNFLQISVPDTDVLLFSTVRKFRPCDVKCENKVSGYGSKVHDLNMKTVYVEMQLKLEPILRQSKLMKKPCDVCNGVLLRC